MKITVYFPCIQLFVTTFFQVCISDINIQQGKITVEELRTKHGSHWVQFYPCDVTNKKQLEGRGCMMLYLKSVASNLNMLHNKTIILFNFK